MGKLSDWEAFVVLHGPFSVDCTCSKMKRDSNCPVGKMAGNHPPQPDKFKRAKATVLYRALFISDIHMSNGLSHAKPSKNGRTDRLDDQMAMLQRFGAYAAKNNIKHGWILGDVFDKKLVDAVTLSETTRALHSLVEEHGLTLGIVPGNHDASSTRGERFTVEAQHWIKGITVFDKPTIVNDLPGIQLCCLPYASLDANLNDIESLSKALGGRVTGSHNVLLMHNSVLGCKHLNWRCDDGIDEKKLGAFKTIISGHFHTSQEFADGRGFYLGAPMHHTFADVGEHRGFWDVTFTAEGVKRTLINGGAPRFHLVEGSLLLPADVKPGDYVRFVIEGTHAEWTAVQSQMDSMIEDVEGSIHIEFKHKATYHHKQRIPGKGAALSVSMEEAIGQYVDAAASVGELDAALLKRLGREAYASTRK